MDLLLDDGQHLLLESAVRLTRNSGGVSRARQLLSRGLSVDHEAWNSAVAAGWTGLMLPEKLGGIGATAFELALFQRQVGRHWLVAPVAQTAICLAAISQAGADDHAARLVDDRAMVVPAIQGARAPYALSGKFPLAEATAFGIRLTGEHRYVSAPPSGALLLTAARSVSGDPLLCLIDPTASGVSLNPRIMADGSSCVDLVLQDLELEENAVIATAANADVTTSLLRNHLLVAASAEILGLVEAAFELGKEHVTLRKQFGKPIGSFQAIQHRLTDAFIAIEVLGQFVFEIAGRVGAEQIDSAMASALKARAGWTMHTVFRTILQMFGATSFADEHDIGLLFKRGLALDAAHGGGMAHASHFHRLAHENPMRGTERHSGERN